MRSPVWVNRYKKQSIRNGPMGWKNMIERQKGYSTNKAGPVVGTAHQKRGSALGEKKRTPIKLELHAEANGKNKRLGGSHFDDWNNRLSDLIASALPVDKAQFLEGAAAAAYGMIEINPADPIEAMIAGQLIVANEAALTMYRRAWAQPSEYFEARSKYLALADKAARTVVLLSERLDQHRTRGQQQIVVKHVTVNAENAMVAENISPGAATSRSPTVALPSASHEKSMPILCDATRNEPVGVGVKAK